MDTSHRIFNLYLHDYILKRDWKNTARALVIEAQIAPHSKPPLDVPQGFLSEWWTVFYAILGPFLQANATTSDDTMLLTLYVYDCLSKQGFHKSAETLLIDADINLQSKPPVDTRQGFLFECWATYWELFGAKRGKRDSPDAVTYVQMQEQQQMHARIQQPRQSSGITHSAQHLAFTPMLDIGAQGVSSSSGVRGENRAGRGWSIAHAQIQRPTPRPPPRRATVGGPFAPPTGSRPTQTNAVPRSMNDPRHPHSWSDMPGRVHTNGWHSESQQLTDSPISFSSGAPDSTLQPSTGPPMDDAWLGNMFLSDMAQLNSEATVIQSPEGEGSAGDFLSGLQQGFTTMSPHLTRDSGLNFYVGGS